MATLKNIAESAGVSVSTVSRILNGKASESGISPKRIKEVTRIARQMDFRFNYAARAIKMKNARHIGVLIRNVIETPHYNPGAFEIIMGINARVASEGYIVSVVRWGDREGRMEEQSRLFREQALDAMFVIGDLPPDIEGKVENLMPRCIWIESHRYNPEHCIRRDEIYSGELAGRALGDAGYRRWLWLDVTPPDSNNQRHYSNPDRLKGVRQMAGKYDAELLMFSQASNLPGDPDELKKYLQPDVGIIAYNHLHANWCALTAAKFKKAAPQDFGLVCCDDVYELQFFWPQLSRVGCDVMAMGQLAGEFALKMIRNPDEPCPSTQMRGFWRPGDTILEQC